MRPAAALVSWFKVFALAACAGGPAFGQVSIAERLTLTGTVEAVAGNRVTVRDEDGTRHEVRVQRAGEQGVPLADGRLLAFPAEIAIGGVVEPATLEPGQVVRFRILLTAKGAAAGAAADITIVDADAATIGVAWPHGPPEGKAAADGVVTAGVLRAGKTRLAVELPAGTPFPKRTVVTGTLVADTRATLESHDLRTLEPGAVVSRLEAVRLDTGDVVARRLAAENRAPRAAARGDDALENRHRSLSDRPPAEPRLVRSQHFAFLTDVSDREWAVIRDKLERMVGVLERFFGRKAGGTVEGFIVRDLAAWPAGLLEEPLGVEKIRRREGVCFNTSLGPARRAVLYSCADHGVIQHECVHGFCHLTFGSTGPTWLSEGVAELGNSWRDGDDAVAIDPLVMGYLQNAPRKRTLGEIAVPGQEPAGSWQDYAWRWALCYLLANNPNYSDRFRPLAVALMEQRPGASFEATYGPVAREVSFEYDRLLETVGNGYRADLTAWPWKAAFRTLAPGGTQKTRVRAAAGWQATGVTLERGGTYEVLAEGTWRTGPAAAPLTAEGDAAGHGRLVGTIFHDFALEPELPLAATGEFTAAADGRLFLRCADDWTQLGDNDGQLDVTIRRR
ncbi:MAG: hypothetical protein ACKO40_14135 [Planctomycetaceae bacterium]